MATTTEYITRPGDRWDLISYKAYGTINMMGDIIRANPDIPITDILPAGLLLQIPIVAVVIDPTDLDLLPPWKK
jgi:phage tail protein X